MSAADFSEYLEAPAKREALTKRYAKSFKTLIDRVDLDLFEVREPQDISKLEYERRRIGNFKFNY